MGLVRGGREARRAGRLTGGPKRCLRIDEEHRLVYVVTNEEVIVIAARYHY
ncbi:type II toxin-antitoxin system YoeB family toxin [Streptomyces nodosus]|uniref:Endoribonuclease YoeB n=1 Tax=Streptomyces nodosus TaxID=40318 RepID=A0A5P2WJ85_9ACTN|nr:hypothetical protein CP978_25730 [Streptomyces nodosus]